MKHLSCPAADPGRSATQVDEGLEVGEADVANRGPFKGEVPEDGDPGGGRHVGPRTWGSRCPILMFFSSVFHKNPYMSMVFVIFLPRFGSIETSTKGVAEQKSAFD